MCLQHTAKITYEAVFKISKRQLLYKCNQCLSKALFGNLYTHLEIVQNAFQSVQQSISVKFRVFRIDFTQFLPFLRVFQPNFCHFLGSEKGIFKYFQGPGKTIMRHSWLSQSTRLISGFSGSVRQISSVVGFARQISIVLLQ